MLKYVRLDGFFKQVYTPVITNQVIENTSSIPECPLMPRPIWPLSEPNTHPKGYHYSDFHHHPFLFFARFWTSSTWNCMLRTLSYLTLLLQCIICAITHIAAHVCITLSLLQSSSNCANRPQFVYSFSSWWIFGSFLVWGHPLVSICISPGCLSRS